MQFFASCPPGLADLLTAELTGFGASEVREVGAGAQFSGPLETAYRACLWSRVASRVLLDLGQIDARSAAALYDGMRAIDWTQHFGPQDTFAIDFAGTSDGITHTQFGALKAKDAIVDQFRAKAGERPSVALERPSVRIAVRLHRGRGSVALDLSGESLHRRGYRARGVAAPLKENLAAGILLRSGWPDIARAGGGFIDPLCGSGTLVIEAAMIAGDIAPQAHRTYFGLLGWRAHDTALWRRLVQEVAERRGAGAVERRGWPYRGYDQDPAAIRAAIENAARAGLGSGMVHFERRALDGRQEGWRDGSGEEVSGLVATNPPYGERIGDVEALRGLYARLGAQLREQCEGWRAVVFTGNPPLAREIGLRARRSHTLHNGALECRLLRFDVLPEHYDLPEDRPSAAERLAQARARPGAQMFANRLAKNLRTLASWARREDVRCYRVYDADMPEYAFAIDLYAGRDQEAPVHACVAEYAAPDTVERSAARARRQEALAVIPEVLGVPPERLHLRTRRPQKGAAQYEKVDTEARYVRIYEGGHEFLVNFTDYLDTGLFLDHRITRRRVGELARGRRFLNLFAYTGSMTVYAVAGGATASTTVDMSHTYLEWAKRNLAINGLAGAEHGFVHGDCLNWLVDEAAAGRRKYDLLFIDPPTFSRSKRMTSDFDVQRDHVRLLELAAQLLAPDGAIVFSNNYSKFRLDRAGLAAFAIEDWTAATLPKDFARNPKIHSCFLLKARALQ